MAVYLNDGTDGDFENRFADQVDVRVLIRGCRGCDEDGPLRVELRQSGQRRGVFPV